MMLLTLRLALFLLVATIGIYHEVLRFASTRFTHIHVVPHLRITLMLTGADFALASCASLRGGVHGGGALHRPWHDRGSSRARLL